MALSNEKIQGYIKRLLLSRMRILCNHGFFGLLLMHMIYSIDEEVETACTDGVRITFGTNFLEQLSDTELDFVMMHEIMHVVLQHCLRGDDKDAENFNIACDIVVNSNILLENNMNAASITLSNYGESIIIEPKPFENEEEFRIIRPAGGGGTDFQIIFEYVAKHMEKPPASIIILTDGYAPFPQEKLAMGIPVLWLLNNEKVDPPWGKVARISV